MNVMFEANKDNPPQYRYEPPVAGAILWVRTLLKHMKVTILPLLEVQEMLESELGQVVRAVILLLNSRIIQRIVNCLAPKMSFEALMLCCTLLRPRPNTQRWRCE